MVATLQSLQQQLLDSALPNDDAVVFSGAGVEMSSKRVTRKHLLSLLYPDSDDMSSMLNLDSTN